MKKFQPMVQIIGSNDGKNWVELNPNSKYEAFCLTDLHLETFVFKYLNILQVLKKPRKKKRKSK